MAEVWPRTMNTVNWIWPPRFGADSSGNNSIRERDCSSENGNTDGARNIKNRIAMQKKKYPNAQRFELTRDHSSSDWRSRSRNSINIMDGLDHRSRTDLSWRMDWLDVFDTSSSLAHTVRHDYLSALSFCDRWHHQRLETLCGGFTAWPPDTFSIYGNLLQLCVPFFFYVHWVMQTLLDYWFALCQPE